MHERRVPSPQAAEALVHQYYQYFNARRFDDAAGLLSVDCEFSHTGTREHAHGRRGYRALVDEWMRAAPDVTLTAESITHLADDLLSVRIHLRGHFRGEFAVGAAVIEGTGRAFSMRGVHRIQVLDGRIVRSEFTFDPADLARLG